MGRIEHCLELCQLQSTQRRSHPRESDRLVLALYPRRRIRHRIPLSVLASPPLNRRCKQGHYQSAPVERAPPPAAFDVDLDLARTLLKQGCPISRVLCEKWEPRTPAAPFLTLMLPLLLILNWKGKPGKGTTFSRAISRHHRGRAALQRPRKDSLNGNRGAKQPGPGEATM
jgi:hypothetical protein